MALHLHCTYDATVPLEVEAILPERVNELSTAQVAALPVYRGKRKHRLDEFFEISESNTSDDSCICWSGRLQAVDGLGQSMTWGEMRVDGTLGNDVGRQMRGGKLWVNGNVGHHVGQGMQGGQIVVDGDAGDHLGGVLPGEKRGMNRGEILVTGNAGVGLGQSMRRGTIVVQGTAGRGCGWNLIAGTIMVFGSVAGPLGVGMRRGTIVCPSTNVSRDQILPSFLSGPCHEVAVFRLFRTQLRSSPLRAKLLDQLIQPLQMFHGDTLEGGRGEIFLAASVCV